MVFDILDLGSNIISSIFALLKTPYLRSVTLLSRKWFHLAAPALIRKVDLAGSPQQVRDFSKFCLKYDLCADIISLTLSETAAYSSPPQNFLLGYVRGTDIAQTALFASALADVLTSATNLAHLAFQDCTDLLVECEPHVADIICQHPPSLSLELSGASASWMKKFSAVSGLTQLTIRTRSRSRYDREEERALDVILLQSIHTLETLSLRHIVPASLRSEHSLSCSWDRVHYFSMSGFSVHPEKLALAFPNIRTLNIADSKSWVTRIWNGRMTLLPPLVYFDCPPRPLWTALRSFSGPKQLALNLSRYHTLRRISFMGAGLYTQANEFAQLSETLLNSDIHSLSLEVELRGTPDGGIPSSMFIPSEIEGSPPLLHTLFSTLSESANYITYLSLHMGKNTAEIPYCLEDLVRTAPLLAPLNNLKYVELGVMTWMGPIPSTLFPIEVAMEPEELLRAWVDGISSLQYLELNVVLKGWDHSWWKIVSPGGTLLRVSEEEGLNARNWFDFEEWK